MTGVTDASRRNMHLIPDAGLRRGRPFLVLAIVCLLLVLIIASSLIYGSINLSPADAFDGLFTRDSGFSRTVVWDIRLPRVLAGILVGASLGIAGSLLQEVTRNPLADPTLLGITAASALCGSILLVIDPMSGPWQLLTASVIGGLLGSAVLAVIAWRGAVSPVRLALSGVAISAFFGAGIVALLSSNQIFLQSSLGFLTGDLYGTGWGEFHVMWPILLPATIAALLVAGRLNILALGDDIAAGLGVVPDRTRLFVLALAGVLTGVAVTTAGVVSFVGLVSPHIARLTVSSDNRLLIPSSALFGAVLVTGADLVARLVLRPSEIPMGLVTAAIGAPFLLYLVRYRG